MQTRAVTPGLAFCAKTENGNDYDKSNTGKVLFSTLAVFDAGGNKLIEAENKKLPASKVIGTLAIAFGLGLGLGEIADLGINKIRRQDADIFAQTGKVPPKTNEGKTVGAVVFSTLGAIITGIANAKDSDKKTKALMLGVGVGAVLGGLLGIFCGFFYDHAVNKFRIKLADKADKAKQ